MLTWIMALSWHVIVGVSNVLLAPATLKIIVQLSFAVMEPPAKVLLAPVTVSVTYAQSVVAIVPTHSVAVRWTLVGTQAVASCLFSP